MEVERDITEAHNRAVRSIAFSPNHKYLADCSFDGSCKIWDTHTDPCSLMCTLEGHENEVKCIEWSASGNLIATCGRDKSVWIWCMEDNNVDDAECLAVLQEHTQDVKMVKWHPFDEVNIG